MAHFSTPNLYRSKGTFDLTCKDTRLRPLPESVEPAQFGLESPQKSVCFVTSNIFISLKQMQILFKISEEPTNSHFG